MKRLYSTDAIVLKNYEWGEADRIVILYTLAQGKVKAIAKGARKPTNSLAPLTQIFAYSLLLLARGKEMDIITQGKLKKDFLSLSQDLNKFAYASYMVELLDRMTEEGEADNYLFETLLAHLYTMEKARDPELIARSWELKLLSHLGYKPFLEGCTICGRKASYFFSPSSGGVVCEICGKRIADALAISPTTSREMERIGRTPPHLLKEEVLQEGVREELRRLLPPYIEGRVGKAGKVKAFLEEEIRQTPAEPPSED